MRPFSHLLAAGLALCLLTPCAGAAGQKEPKSDAPDKGVDRKDDALPEGAVSRFGSKRLRHASLIYATAFSPDGKLLASASADNSVRVWETSTGKEKQAFTFNNEQLTSVVYFKDGKTLAAASMNGTIHILDVDNGKQKLTLTGHGQGQLRLALHSDDGKLFSASFDGSVREWDADKGKEVRIFASGVGALTALAVSGDGKTLAVATQAGNGGLTLFDTDNGKELRKLPWGKGQIEALAFTADGKALAVGAQFNNSLGLYDVENGKEVQPFRANNSFGAVKGLAFSPSGKVLASCVQGPSVSLWGVASGKQLRHLDLPGTIATHVAYSPDGKIVAVACQDNMIHLWDVENGNVLHEADGFSGAIQQIRFLADGTTLVASDQQRSLRAMDARTGKALAKLRGTPFSQVASWGTGPEGKTIVYANYDRSLRFWDPLADKEERRIENFTQFIYQMAFSNDGTTLAMVENNRVLRIHAAESGNEIKQFTAAPNQNFGFLTVLSSDGRRIVASGYGPIFVWDVPSGRELWKGDPTAPQQQLLHAVFAPDGRTLACVSANQVLILEIVSRQERLRIERPQNAAKAFVPQALTFSPDGNVLAIATATGEVFLHDVATGKEIGQFNGHRGAVYALAFSPDNRLLASGGADTTVIVWDAASLIKKNRPAAASPTEAEVASLWQNISGEGAKVHRLLWAMTAEPKKSVEVLKGKLQPGPPADPKRIAKLVADLDNEDFDTREKASEALAGIPEADMELKKALENNPSVEKKRRIEALLENRKPGVVGADQIREARAVELLEMIGTPEAKQLLEKLAKGSDDSTLTQDCKAALDRLSKRKASPSPP
jgi:WD40 repeat protein